MQKKRKFIKKITKKKLRRVLKELIIKGYIYSLKEAQRLGLEYREFVYYLQPFLIKKIRYNEDGNNRFYFYPTKKLENILNTSIKELIVYEDNEAINFVKLLFCEK